MNLNEIVKERSEELEMKNNEPQQGLTAIEKMQELNKVSKMEYENGLLKENLMEFTELFEQLKIEQNNFLQEVERNLEYESKQNLKTTQELKNSVNSLRQANELLNNNMKSQIENLTLAVRNGTVEAVQKGLKQNIETLNIAVSKMADMEIKLLNQIQSHLDTYEQKQRRFFAFDGARKYLFWIGSGINIVTFLLVLFLVVIK